MEQDFAMCVSPMNVNGVEVPCRKCKQCVENAVRDWQGRCIAESKTSWASSCGTLTYGYDDHYGSTDHWHARHLVYSDVQKYLKLMRKNGAPLRYFVTGEYGSEKGRSHWHINAFWLSHYPPNYKEWVRYDHYADDGKKLWEHGFTYWKPATNGDMKYATKYITKDFHRSDVEKVKMGLSRMPPLGAVYFRYVAQLHVEHGLAPQDLYYGFPDDRVKKTGLARRYRLTGASAYQYLKAFDELWQMKHHNDRWPHSDLMDEYVDERDRRARRALGQADYEWDVFYARHDLERKARNTRWTLPIEGVATAVAQRLQENRYRIISRGDYSDPQKRIRA